MGAGFVGVDSPNLFTVVCGLGWAGGKGGHVSSLYFQHSVRVWWLDSDGVSGPVAGTRLHYHQRGWGGPVSQRRSGVGLTPMLQIYPILLDILNNIFVGAVVQYGC